MTSRNSVIFAWSAPFFMVVFFPLFLLMGFFPPPSPSLNAVEIAQLITAHKYQILAGSAFVMNGCALCLLWVVAISDQIRRIDTPSAPLLANAQFVCGAVNVFLLTVPGIMWTLAAFRPDTRSPDITYLLNDAAWITLLMPVGSAIVQAVVIAMAILSDQSPSPIYPRWAAYMNLWVGLAFVPSMFVAFFKHGPFAWNGIFDFYMPVLAFSIWLFVMAHLTASAAKRQAAVATP